MFINYLTHNSKISKIYSHIYCLPYINHFTIYLVYIYIYLFIKIIITIIIIIINLIYYYYYFRLRYNLQIIIFFYLLVLFYPLLEINNYLSKIVNSKYF